MTKRPHHKLPRGPRHAGICRHAEALGVSRGHLHMVLTGRRGSKSLLRRYQELRRRQAAAPASDAA
jgi:hypothetical protein